MPRGGARGQNLGHLNFFYLFFFFFFFMESLVFNNRYFLGLTLSATCDPRVKCPWGGARGQNLEHLRIFLDFFCF